MLTKQLLMINIINMRKIFLFVLIAAALTLNAQTNKFKMYEKKDSLQMEEKIDTLFSDTTISDVNPLISAEIDSSDYFLGYKNGLKEYQNRSSKSCLFTKSYEKVFIPDLSQYGNGKKELYRNGFYNGYVEKSKVNIFDIAVISISAYLTYYLVGAAAVCILFLIVFSVF